MITDPVIFGRQLIETNDLDPVYVVLHHADLPKTVLRKWLLSYWCFYHSGTASWISEQSDYWSAMMTAARSKEYPRCPERRHFRGKNAEKSVEWLRGHSVYDLLSPLTGTISVQEAMEYVQTWVGFGPWIAFKVADMVERLGLCKVRFDDAAMFLFDSPQEGAERLLEYTGIKTVQPQDAGKWAVSWLTKELSKLKAPPRYERLVNAQEIETVLCKWNSHAKGHYEIGEDIEALHKSLSWRETAISKRLLAAGHVGGLW